jgi:hypothetical protein
MDFGATMWRVPGYGDHLEATVDPDIRARQASAPEGFEDAMWTRSAVIRDPQGAELTLSQFAPHDDWG